MTKVVHVVLARWSADDDGSSATEAERLTDAHLANIPGVLGVTRGPSTSPEGLEGGFEWGLVVEFEDAAARDAYLPHPEHAPVAEHLRAHAASVVVFDLDAGA